HLHRAAVERGHLLRIGDAREVRCGAALHHRADVTHILEIAAGIIDERESPPGGAADGFLQHRQRVFHLRGVKRVQKTILQQLAFERVDAHAGQLLARVVLRDLHGGRLAHAQLLIVLLPQRGEHRRGVRVRFLKIKLPRLPAELQLHRLILSAADA
ncbi:MAG: hypothetical protein ACK56I_11145, partial [bacterium]